MKQIWKRNAKRVGAATLSLLLLTTLIPFAAAVNPVVDEAYYGTLDYYGALKQGSVVKSYRTNGNTEITDTGSYDQVTNLTDRTQPAVDGDKVTFRLGDNAPANFYFEGATEKPFETMPFTINLSYRMNGVDTEAADMAGQTGVGEILLDVVPNKAATEYAQNNFVLEAMTVLKDTDILSVEAPGGQVQKIGNMDVVLYVVMPGEEQHFTLRVGADSFTFNGFTFLIEPATLAQLDDLADLRDAKGDIEGSANDLSDSIDAILNSLDGMDGSLRQAASGLDQLDAARKVISTGKGQVYDEADRALASMTDLSDSLTPVVEHLKTAKTALRETTDQVNDLSTGISNLRPELQNLKGDLQSIQGDLNSLNSVINTAKGDTGKLRDELSVLQDDLETLKDHLQDLEDDTGDLSTALKDTDFGANSLTPITIVKGGKTYTTQQVRDAHDMADSIYQICISNPPFSSPYTEDDSKSMEEKEAAFVWFITEKKDTIIGVAADQAAKKAADAEAAKQAAAAGLTPGSPEYEDRYQAVYTVVYSQAFAAAQTEYQEQLTEEAIPVLSYLHYEWTDGDGVEAQLTQAETFNEKIEEANSSLSGANSAIKAITKPTAAMLTSLQNLLDDLDEDMLDHCQDTLSTLNSLLKTGTSYDNDALNKDTNAIIDTSAKLIDRMDTILDQSKTLSDTVTKYEPDAQSALDDAENQVNSSVKLLNNLNTFSKAFENLLQSSGTDLDQGSADTFAGLSDTLRRSANALNTTGTIRRAKSSMTDLIKDKWHEYTGDKNNLLNMDSNAQMVSLTSDQNQTPNSIQILLRSQEITVPDDDNNGQNKNGAAKTTFWQRVVRMFQDFGAIFTGD